MNRGVFHSSSSVQQMMGGTNPNWWSSISNMKPPSGDETSLLYPFPSSSSSSSPLFHHYSHQPSSLLLPPMFPFQDNQELPESWSQLLLGGGLVGEDADQRCVSLNNPFQDQVVYSSASRTQMGGGGGDVKQESSESGYVYGHGAGSSTTCDEIHAGRSCVTTSFSSNMLDFSNSNKAEKRQAQAPDHSSECNSTANGAAFKKARVQGSSSPQSTFKVRKEKLGDRITALHQLVSPFGKTDTASVLLEAIGYIRFLQGQIEALSSPYLTTSSGIRRQSAGVQGETNCVFPEDPGQLLNDNNNNNNNNNMKKRGPKDQGVINDEAKKDLRSRGLCLVPVSCTLHVGSENGADYWAPTFGAGFR